MEYNKSIILKDGRSCLIRNCTGQDARAALDNFILTHEQTDFLMSYPDEITFTLEQERDYLDKKTLSVREVELMAEVDGTLCGMAGIEMIGSAEKTRGRASFGISLDKAWWGLGIGRALTQSCIECARTAGYSQLELDVVANNERAVALYKSVGFVEYGRNPRGFCSRLSGWQELVLMRLELD